MIVIQTNHFVNRAVTDCFAIGTNSQKINIENFKYNKEETIATYGVLRGTGDILKKSKNFYYMDHGYISSSERSFAGGSTLIKSLEGYFRVVKNDFIGFKKIKCDSIRLERLNLKFKPKRKNGEFIILSEPSEHMVKFFGLSNWVNNTIDKLKNFTDRKIIVHNKFSEIPLDNLLKNAWAFVSFQSNAGFKAMIEGVPAHFTYNNLKHINSLENIESGKIDYEIFKSLSYSQWTLKEIAEGSLINYI